MRMRSVTGRTCTVILSRDPALRTTREEFQMTDLEEWKGTVEWVRRPKSAFGIAVA